MSKLTRNRITEIALDNGFTLKEQPDGTVTLNPYVFDFVDAIVTELDREPDPRHKSIGVFPQFSNTKTIVGFDKSTGNYVVTPVDCSCVLVKDGDKFLGVSRKHDHTDIGLPGGKVESGESFEEAAIRETLEETGYHIRLIDVQPYATVADGAYSRTFLAEIVDDNGSPAPLAIHGELGYRDDAVFGFFSKEKFISGSYREYNEGMFKHFMC